MKRQTHDKHASNLVMKFVGGGLVALALLLSIPVAPLLLFAHNSRELTGGIVGGILVLLIGLAGIVLFFREKTRLMQTFYFTFGGLSVLVGIALVGYAIYENFQGPPQKMNRGKLGISLLFISMGIYWIRQGLMVSSTANARDPQSADYT